MTPSPSQLFVVDVETTGPDPFVHEPLSVALVSLLDKEDTPFQAYVRIDDPVWTDYARNNFKSFRDEWNAQAVNPVDAVSALAAYLKIRLGDQTATLVGHNVGFDMAFLRKLAFRAGMSETPNISHRTIDTHTLLYLAYVAGKIPEGVLSSDAAFSYFKIDIPEKGRHTALHDALATRKLIHLLLGKLGVDISDLLGLAERPAIVPRGLRPSGT